MSTTSTGRDAELKVATALKNAGHTIVSRNWRTRWCEIDVVTIRKKVVYFTEVKYRSSSTWGDGLDYINAKKLTQMKYAAEFWLNENRWKSEAQLQVAAVDSQSNIELIQLDSF